MTLSITPLFSGSSGNAILISSDDTKILIDAGVSGKRTEQALASVGVQAGEIKGILISHEHSDHIQGAGVLSRKHNIPLYATRMTWQAANGKLGNILAHNMREIGKSDFFVDDLLVEPFDTPHDAADSVGFCVSRGAKKIGVATDLGYFPKSVEHRLHACDLVLLEANHDKKMLAHGPYPHHLKQRIKSRHGHLSNDDAAHAAIKLTAAGVSSILLGHLSEQNNEARLAFRTVTDALMSEGIVPGKDISLGLALRDAVTGVFYVK
ncbi:MAG: MBL fold metallo-hydrolase [Clostridia bacterium]|jgi:phosphoribosyl 1,2-cyclic phosphodiesterase|nr:MBL fold metallo-hydrolase [Clostridia bacterium]